MWILIFILLLNSSINQSTIQNEYRFSIGFAQVGIVEITVVLSFLYALVFGQRTLEKYPSRRMHPAMLTVLILLCIGAFMGLIGALINQAPAPLLVRNVREYMSLPICLLIGYRLLPNPKWAWRVNYVIVIAGILTATMLIWTFLRGSEKVQWGASWNQVRTTWFCTFHAGIASILLFYSMVNTSVRILPMAVAFPIAGYCLLGQFAPMHRTDWIAVTITFLAALALLPREKMGITLVRLVIVVPAAAMVLAVGVRIGDHATGRDFGSQVMRRIESIMPTERRGNEGKAWDSRTGSVRQEFAIWLGNPILGRGFSVQATEVEKGNMNDTQAYFHNAVTSVLATTGLFGFAGWVLFMSSMIVVGSKMVRHPVDRSSITLGLYGYCIGVFLIIEAICTMIWMTRTMMLCGIVGGMMFRARDWEAHTLALQEQAQDETWLYEHGYYNAEGGWLSPGQI
jgi:hypothetical protein